MDGVLATVIQVTARYVGAEDGAIDPDANLAELGVDSLGVVGLLGDIESAFNLRMPDELLTAETFGSPRSLAQAIGGILER